jgi:signal transduction histidine kinase
MQLLHSQKLEALGTLAGGIAHELNNILAPILALSKLTIEELPIDSGARADLEMVVMASERARDLVRQILAFSRKQQLDKRVIDLAAVTRRVLQMMRASLPSTIEMVDRIESVPPFFGDAGQLQQVIVNLVGNAAQAIRNGTGTVTISLAAVPTGAVAGRDELQLTVSDTGHGMDEATIDRIFEPFFTTKEVDAGTGLGLSVALGIVAEHGGCINVRSTCGKGSEFTIFLPTCELPAGEQGVGETVT